MKIEFSDIKISKKANVEYGFGEYGLGIYFYTIFNELLLFIPEKYIINKLKNNENL